MINPDLKLTPEGSFYIINGIPYVGTDSLQLDSVLHSLELKYFLGVYLLDCTNILHCNRDVVIVAFAYAQKAKTKRLLLKKARQRLRDNYISFSPHIDTNVRDPVLYIDNKLIHPADAGKKIRALKQKSVYHIDISNEPAKEEQYGQNAKNGLIRIWTVQER